MKNKLIHKGRARSKSYLISIAILAVLAYTCCPPVQAQESFDCTLSDLSIDAAIPDGYVRIPTKCPVVSYKKLLSPNHALGFYFIETTYPYSSFDKNTPAQAVSDYVSIVLTRFDKAHKGQSYNAERHDDLADFPPSLISHGGACGGLVAKTPVSYQGREGVQWRQGIMCLVELSPKRSDKWVMIQAFFFAMDLGRTDYRPKAAFQRAARRLFRSIHLRANNKAATSRK